MELYYVRCKSCNREIELDRKPDGENIATAFSAVWAKVLICASCGANGDYSRQDIKNRPFAVPKCHFCQPPQTALGFGPDREENIRLAERGELVGFCMYHDRIPVAPETQLELVTQWRIQDSD